MTRRLDTLTNSYKVELVGPDLSPYREGTGGIPYALTFRAPEPGPHVAISAIVHGNEPCGAIALDTLLKEDVRPRRGTLSFIFVNVAAYESFDPDAPNASRWLDEDFNRLWSAQTLDGPRQSSELERARVLRPLLDEIDLLLDIHSMQHKVEPLMMAGPAPKGVALAKAVGIPRTIVVDQGHAAGPRMRDYGGFISPSSAKNALLMECGQHWEASAEPLALATAVRFLAATGAVAPDFWADRITADLAPQRVLEITHPITIETEDFHFTEKFVGMDVIADAGTVIAHDGDRPVTTPYPGCVLIMPSMRLWPGQTAVRLGRYLD
ncbi:MAG: succinylglutamate desuccinylase/aspartoacylase family protein [Pseudomonadota bacterium]